jgi:lipopolysaccharide/colanic/teichoic acid biosynthesis glycosyltransferase
MKAIIFFNLITNLIIIGVYLQRNSPFYFAFERTFWYKRPYAIRIWRKTSYGAECVWGFNFRNEERAEAHDEECFKNQKL